MSSIALPFPKAVQKCSNCFFIQFFVKPTLRCTLGQRASHRKLPMVRVPGDFAALRPAPCALTGPGRRRARRKRSRRSSRPWPTPARRRPAPSSRPGWGLPGRTPPTMVCEKPWPRRWHNAAAMWPGSSRKPLSVQTAWNGKFQERWTVASGKNKVRGESGKATKP